MAAQGLAQPVPDAGTRGDGPRWRCCPACRCCADCMRETVADIARAAARRAGDHRQPGLHACACSRACAARHSARAVRRAAGLGAGARAGCATSPACGTGCSACCRSSRRSSRATTCRRASSAIRCWNPAPIAATPRAFRARHDLAARRPLLVLMPGSRRSEVAAPAAGLWRDAWRCCARRVPGLRAGDADSPPRSPACRAAATASWPVRPMIVTDIAEKHDAYAAAARGADQVRHLDAGTGAGRRADGGDLSGQPADRGDRAAADPRAARRHGQPARRPRDRAGTAAAGLHAGPPGRDGWRR